MGQRLPGFFDVARTISCNHLVIRFLSRHRHLIGIGNAALDRLCFSDNRRRYIKYMVEASSLPYSDAVVFFGATGDLAYKQIFPSLQKLARRGKLAGPVIGVAKAGWNLDQLQATGGRQRRKTRRT